MVRCRTIGCGSSDAGDPLADACSAHASGAYDCQFLRAELFSNFLAFTLRITQSLQSCHHRTLRPERGGDGCNNRIDAALMLLAGRRGVPSIHACLVCHLRQILRRRLLQRGEAGGQGRDAVRLE